MDERKLNLFTIGLDQSLEDGMALIETNHHRSVIVLNDAQVVVGALSDGDIRRALLDRRLPRTPIRQVMNTDFVALTTDQADQAPAIFARGYISLIPVVDKTGRLMDVLSA